MKIDAFADNEVVACWVNCWLEDQYQKLFCNIIRALGRH